MILNTWATFIYFFSQWLLTIIVTRLNGYEDSGIFSLSVSFCNIFSFISKFGMRGIQVGDIQEKYSHGQYFTSRVLTTLASIVLFVPALILCGYQAELRDSCIAMMCFKAFEGFDDVAVGSFQKTFRYKQIAISYTLKAILTFVVVLIGLLLNVRLSQCIWFMSLAYLLVLVFYDYLHLKDLAFLKWQTNGMKQLLVQCVPLLIVGIIDAILVFLPRNAIEQVLGSEELGYYSSISVLVVVFSTLAGAVWGTVLVRYSEILLEKQWDAFKRLILGCLAALIVIGAAIIVLGSLIGPWFFALLYGDEILTHMYLLLPVLISAVLLLYNSFFTCICIPINRRRLLMVTDLIAVIICAGTVNYATVRFGSLGACYSLVISQVVRFALLVCFTALYTRKHIRAASVEENEN